MTTTIEQIYHFTIADALRQLSTTEGKQFIRLMERGTCSVEFFAPKVVDLQSPHARDEVYVVVSGNGTFVKGDEHRPVAPGDLIYVPKGEPHRFETFTDDFAAWVVFF